MLALKSALDAWLMPLPLGLTLSCCGLLLRARGRQRSGTGLIAASAVMVLAAATGPIADALLRPLETRYQAIADASALRPVPRYVCVLGSGYRPRPGLPITAELDAVGIVRLAEGIRLLRQLPGAHLIVSGGALHGEPPVAEGYARAAAALGVPPESIIAIDTPRDTAEEIDAIRARVGDEPGLLVTSAAHMTRAMAYSSKAGLRAVPAPTDNLSASDPRAPAWIPAPSGTALRKTETALHEYLGLLAFELGIP
jgi:uncharacterized SAM-binding protein YcdF (DUF218 family)